MTRSGTCETRLKLGVMEALLPHDEFLLCHRFYIVKLACVRRIRRYEFLLEGGTAVPVSKARYNEVGERFRAYISLTNAFHD